MDFQTNTALSEVLRNMREAETVNTCILIALADKGLRVALAEMAGMNAAEIDTVRQYLLGFCPQGEVIRNRFLSKLAQVR